VLYCKTDVCRQYLCEILDRNRHESKNGSQRIMDTMTLLHSSMRASSRTIENEIRLLASETDCQRGSIEQLLKEMKELQLQVEHYKDEVRMVCRKLSWDNTDCLGLTAVDTNGLTGNLCFAAASNSRARYCAKTRT
jgi:hypothetical protein